MYAYIHICTICVCVTYCAVHISVLKCSLCVCVYRITRLLIEQDGSEWRRKLPEIPLVPLSAQQHRREEPPNAELLQARTEKAAQDAGVCDADTHTHS